MKLVTLSWPFFLCAICRKKQKRVRLSDGMSCQIMEFRMHALQPQRRKDTLPKTTLPSIIMVQWKKTPIWRRFINTSSRTPFSTSMIVGGRVTIDNGKTAVIWRCFSDLLLKIVIFHCHVRFLEGGTKESKRSFEKLSSRPYFTNHYPNPADWSSSFDKWVIHEYSWFIAQKAALKSTLLETIISPPKALLKIISFSRGNVSFLEGECAWKPLRLTFDNLQDGPLLSYEWNYHPYKYL